jgi:branched-chain amino acid transport system permease protein
LIFGVIDGVDRYAELVMVGMYGINLLQGWGTVPGRPVRHCSHRRRRARILVIRPVLDSAPINQLLVTGGVLIFLQAAATMAFGIDFKNLGLRLGSSMRRYELRGRALPSLVALAGMLALCCSSSARIRHRHPRHLPGPADHAADGRRQPAYRHFGHRRRAAGLAATLMVLQYDIYPRSACSSPLIFMICVLGGLGNMIGGFIAAFIISQFIAVGSSCFHTEWGYAVAFLFFMVAIFIRPQGLFGGKS